jgi:acyl-CoA synthetase (AMP-forming)/AMP-acid ligase II
VGLQKGDKVALLAYNCVEWMEIYAALARAGLVAVPINFRLTSTEIEYIAQHSDAMAFIVQDELIDRVEPIKSQLKISNKAYLAFGDNIPSCWTHYESLISAAPTYIQPIEVLPTDVSALMYTSGTTGKPKGAIRSHEGSTMIALATALELGFTSKDTSLLVMPMCHANSLYFANTFIHLGACIVVDDRASFDPEHLLMLLSKHEITFTSMVPTHYIMMLALPEDVKKQYATQSVGRLLVSSAPANANLKRAIQHMFPNGQLYELYGSTEAGWVTLLRPDEQLRKLGSVGREWIGSGPIKLLDAQRQEVPDGEVGELYSCTSYAFEGYWGSPEKTAEAFADAWCSVGDMAMRDTDGFIWLMDRKSNMIISGGENIYPSEVEAVLCAHPAVQEAAVIGVPHDKWGETVLAVVVTKAGQDCSADALKQWCKERLAAFKQPRHIEFISAQDMPRTATGKIVHRRLRDLLALRLTETATN